MINKKSARLVLTSALVLGSAVFAVASAMAQGQAQQVADTTNRISTELHIDSSGVVHAPPDILTISLFAQKSASTPAAAQIAVNALVKQATQRAAAFKNVGLSIASYDVSREGDKTISWTARQTLQIRATDAAPLLDLAGQLQTTGLAIGSMEWSLSDENREKLTHDAEVKALADLRQRATMVAQAMGMKILSFKSITLGERRLPVPGVMMARMVAAPQSTPQEQEISATASATVVLAPQAQ